MVLDIATSIDAEIQRIEEDCRQRVQRLQECKRVVADPQTLELLMKFLNATNGTAAPAAIEQPAAAAEPEQPATAAAEQAAPVAEASAGANTSEPQASAASAKAVETPADTAASRIAAIHRALSTEEKVTEKALAASAA
ncbi:MAG: hypothetical protein U0Q16_29845 [Bryobacteraceae bacterium]